MPLVLNVGGGSKGVAIPSHFDGWEHLLLDISPHQDVDLVCDARLLSEKFLPSSYEAIYCSHNLEHYYGHDVAKVLKGFLHVLTEEGFAEIRVPDIGELIKLMASAQLDIDREIYRSSMGPITAHDMIYGYGPEIESSGQDFYAHKTGFTLSSLEKTLLRSGFAEVYFAAPLTPLELHVFAFKRPASEQWKTRLSLGKDLSLVDEPGRLQAQLPAAANSPPIADVSDSLDNLYGRAVDAWNTQRWSEAAALADKALAIDPTLPALHYLLGCCRLELGQMQSAAADFEQCAGLHPPYPLHSQALVRQALCLARDELRSGRKPVSKILAGADRRTVSVVICSNSAARFNEAKAMYQGLLAEVPHEIIGIHDARSLAEGYNRGLAQARNEVIVFSHDDVEIVSPDFAAGLLAGLEKHDVVGIAGANAINGGAWHFAGHPHIFGQIAMRNGTGLAVTSYGVSSATSGKLLVLDGALFATTREIAKRIGFDEQSFDGWHLYDLDFTLRAARAGLDCATCNDILVLHASKGNYDKDWARYAERFLSKHSLDQGKAAVRMPDLVSFDVASVDEWRLLTGHLISLDSATGKSDA
jgi:tetratricopeptide (TPR) repeat protein